MILPVVFLKQGWPSASDFKKTWFAFSLEEHRAPVQTQRPMLKQGKSTNVVCYKILNWFHVRVVGENIIHSIVDARLLYAVSN